MDVRGGSQPLIGLLLIIKSSPGDSPGGDIRAAEGPRFNRGDVIDAGPLPGAREWQGLIAGDAR